MKRFSAKEILELLGDILLISGGTAFLVVWLIMALTGRAFYEPNPFILWAEALLFICFIIIGINRLHGDWRE